MAAGAAAVEADYHGISSGSDYESAESMDSHDGKRGEDDLESKHLSIFKKVLEEMKADPLIDDSIKAKIIKRN